MCCSAGVAVLLLLLLLLVGVVVVLVVGEVVSGGTNFKGGKNVHPSQISSLCDCLSVLSPSSAGKNTLSCGLEIIGACIVVQLRRE